jgi:hypothetical protein
LTLHATSSSSSENGAGAGDDYVVCKRPDEGEEAQQLHLQTATLAQRSMFLRSLLQMLEDKKDGQHTDVSAAVIEFRSHAGGSGTPL